MKSISDSMQQALNNKLNSTRYGYMSKQLKALYNTVWKDEDVNAFVKKYHISKDTYKNSFAKFYEFVQEKEKAKYGKQNLFKNYIPYLIFENNSVDISYKPSPAFKKLRYKSYLNNLVKLVGITDKIRQNNLDKMDKSEARDKVLLATKIFIEKYKKRNNEFVKGLYLYGEFGVGKTHLLGAIANKLAKEMNVQTTIVNFPSFLTNLKDLIGNKSKQNLIGKRIDEIKKSQVLMIDDIGAGSMSQWERDEVLAVILEYRMQNELTTFFSSNVPMKKLDDQYLLVDRSGQIEDKNQAKRMMQRVQFLAKQVKFDGENRRKLD